MWFILTPTVAPGAIAVISLSATTAGELNAALAGMGLGELPRGAVKLRDFFGIDTGVAARWTDTVCHLMPHGGVGVVRAITRRLLEVGCKQDRTPDVMALYSEAGSVVDARMLEALSRAASPLAVDLLLDQPRRWGGGAGESESDPARDRVLDRLIEPALVVALGPANVGKSTLVNTLAGRSVAIVADEPGTTRDHVGVMLDLGGLVVRYLDTPGMRGTGDDIERESQAIALAAAGGADLILLVGDAASPPAEVAVDRACLRVALRSDLGAATWPHDVAVSALNGQGIPELVAVVRERLVPSAALEDARPWRFWKDPATPTTRATGLW